MDKKSKQKSSLEWHENLGIAVPIGKNVKKKKNKNKRDNEDVTAEGQELKNEATDGAEGGELISKESKGKERKKDKKKKKKVKGDNNHNELEQDVSYNVGKVINGSEGKDGLPKSVEARETDEKNNNSNVRAQKKEMDENNSHSSLKPKRKKDKKSCTLDPSEVDAEDGELKGTDKAGVDDKKRNKNKTKHRDDEKSVLLVSESPVKGSCGRRNKTAGGKDLAESEKFEGSDDKMIKKKKEKRKDHCHSEFKDTNKSYLDNKDKKKKESKHRDVDKPLPLTFESPAEGSCDGRSKTFDSNDLTKSGGFRGSDDKTIKKKEKKKRKKKDGDFGFETEATNESELCSDNNKKRKRKNDIDNSATATEKQKGKKKKRVSFSGAVEVFPLNGDSENEKAEERLIYGKRFTPQEDQKVRDAIDEYITRQFGFMTGRSTTEAIYLLRGMMEKYRSRRIDLHMTFIDLENAYDRVPRDVLWKALQKKRKHQLGEEGIQMILKCSKYPQVKDCWKEIGTCLPYRPREAIYYRAHCLLERSELRKWTPEEYDKLRSFYKTHGADWKTLAGKLGKHRFHVKDAWRRVKSPNFKKGNWSQDEYQSLFDLVNLDLRMKVNEEKDSKHGMLRDNIHWEAISDKLTTRYNAACCIKWYKQLTSPLVSEGVWADVDDYMLIDELIKTDACCIEDVDWDNLLEHRSGEICRRRWDQMTRHLGSNREKPFIEQLQVLSKRYCPEMAEYRK